MVRISLLINALNKRVLLFSEESYFIKAIVKKTFFPVIAYPDINNRVVGRILDSYANPSRVYIRLCKHGKRFLLLKSNNVVPEVKLEQTKVCLDKALEAKNEWVQISTRLLKKEEIEKGDAIAWLLCPGLHGQLITPLNKRLHMGFQLCVQCFLSSMRSLLHPQY